MDMISVGLQKSLVAAQHKLWMAIKEHQKFSQKLSGNPNDPQDKHLQARMRMIEIKILEIDRWQKDLYCQLRKEIAALNSETALHAAKLWLAEALQLNNNNHIIRNGGNVSLVNGHASSSSNASEDEEPLPLPPPQQNGDVVSPLRGQHSPASFNREGREASTSGSADEVDGSPEVLSEEEQPGALLAAEAEDKKGFLGCIGLISHERLGEIERRRNQRKRRSNVRSQFLYSAPQPPQKRKRYTYLQSGNAPQTRQTTARLNGPSPTPSTKSNGRTNNKASTSNNSSGSKSLYQVGKATTTANSVLRNGELANNKQHKEFSIKQKTDNGNGTMKISSTGKTVHIPGLPPSLTVEWIDKDSTICISCRNPGSLTMCESCTSKFHVSCHTTSPASTTHCPKCVIRFPVKAIGCAGNDLEILRHEVKHVKKEYRDKEERERLRERNADLRFQLSELEKRSQLISQSLQEQQANRHELTAKEERTQSCIKRLVNFIRLMQLRPGNSSSSPSLPSTSSNSCPPRPSSYPSPALPSLSPHQHRLHHMTTTIPIPDQTLDSAATWPKLSDNFPKLASPQQHRETNGEDWRSNPRDSYKDDQVMRVAQPIPNQYPYCTTTCQINLPQNHNLKGVEAHLNDDIHMNFPVSPASITWVNGSPRPPSPAITSPSKSSATTATEPTMLPAKTPPMVSTLSPKELQMSSAWNHSQELKNLHRKNLKYSTSLPEVQNSTPLFLPNQNLNYSPNSKLSLYQNAHQQPQQQTNHHTPISELQPNHNHFRPNETTSLSPTLPESHLHLIHPTKKDSSKSSLATPAIEISSAYSSPVTLVTKFSSNMIIHEMTAQAMTTTSTVRTQTAMTNSSNNT